MFEEMLRTFDELSKGTTYKMDILPDEDGYYDKECPNEDCMSKFKVYAEDWQTKFSEETVYCPFCGYVSPARSWWTTEQVEQAMKQAKGQLVATINQAISEDVKRFNRSQSRKSLVRFSMKFSGITSFVNLPALALEKMEQKIECDSCGAHYAVVGSAFYCPCCGKNSAKLTFNNTINKVRAKIKNLPLIHNAIAAQSRDEAERTCNSLIESSASDLVVAFQRVCECIYPQIDGALPLRKNVFQRLDEGNGLWVGLIGEGYHDWVTPQQYSKLKKCFQQRHLLQHQDGIVNQDYITKSGDTSYCIGQRVIIKEQDISEYADIIETIGNHVLALKYG